jgi:nucleotidyltransferase/DNA polymerase involved in DNA repair
MNMTQVLNQFGAVVERASIDEAYLDLSPVVDRRQGTLLLANSQDPDVSYIRNSKLRTWIWEALITY